MIRPLDIDPTSSESSRPAYGLLPAIAGRPCLLHYYLQILDSNPTPAPETSAVAAEDSAATSANPTIQEPACRPRPPVYAPVESEYYVALDPRPTNQWQVRRRM